MLVIMLAAFKNKNTRSKMAARVRGLLKFSASSMRPMIMHFGENYATPHELALYKLDIENITFDDLLKHYRYMARMGYMASHFRYAYLPRPKAIMPHWVEAFI